ncbi:unnamed protein product [Oikopleura dioica]|uniref:Uncharacterized protein n=1 Tax=Oikopleura dioica TaxID=34765 RepID=E4X9P1_OIKDI|nr:unnamed protein product [Oikopleura dioica]
MKECDFDPKEPKQKIEDKLASKVFERDLCENGDTKKQIDTGLWRCNICTRKFVSRATLQKHLNSPFNGHVYDLDCFTITDPEIRKVGEQARKLWRQKEIEKAEKCNLDVVTKKERKKNRHIINAKKALAKKEKEERKKLKELEASYRIEAMRDKPASSTENFSSVSSLEDCNFIDEVSSEAGLGNLSTGTGSGTGFSILSFKFRQEAVTIESDEPKINAILTHLDAERKSSEEARARNVQQAAYALIVLQNRPVHFNPAFQPRPILPKHSEKRLLPKPSSAQHSAYEMSHILSGNSRCSPPNLIRSSQVKNSAKIQPAGKIIVRETSARPKCKLDEEADEMLKLLAASLE